MAIVPAPDLVVAGRFRLVRPIGRGGMGSVWLAMHLGLDVPCAVKFIEGEGAQLPEAQARFEREAKAAAQLRSPHVVQILDHGVYAGTPYIAMELLEGEDLGKRLSRLGRLSPDDVLAVVRQVARALAKAHALGVVHRDLKPDNIFLARDDDREIAKVLDFGIAKAAVGSAVGTNTRTGALLGTPYYMSPEQAQGTKAIDARSDLWALAVIVFEALTGRRPFDSDALGDLLIKIIMAPVPMPSQLAPDLPPSLDGWWARASQRDPARRYQSAKELSEGLALALGRSANDAPELSFRAAPAAAPSPPKVLATAAAPAFTGAPIARTYGERASTSKRRAAVGAGVGAGALALAAGGLWRALRVREPAPVTPPPLTTSPAQAAPPPTPPSVVSLEHVAPPPEPVVLESPPVNAAPSAFDAGVARPVEPAPVVVAPPPLGALTSHSAGAGRPLRPTAPAPRAPTASPSPAPAPSPTRTPVDLGF
jgi:serine/threonine-protein kinase